MARFIIGAGSTRFGECLAEVVAAFGKGADDIIAKEIIGWTIQHGSSIQAGENEMPALPEELPAERKARGRDGCGRPPVGTTPVLWKIYVNTGVGAQPS
jgi:hypothetical protein